MSKSARGRGYSTLEESKECQMSSSHQNFCVPWKWIQTLVDSVYNNSRKRITMFQTRRREMKRREEERSRGERKLKDQNIGVWFIIPEERIEIEWKSRLHEEKGGKFMKKREKKQNHQKLYIRNWNRHSTL